MSFSTMFNLITIFTMAIFVIVFVSIIIVIIKVITKTREFSRHAFGTSDFMEGYHKTQEEIAHRPKSVSSMTRIFEPQIRADFPEFVWEEFKHKSENMLISAFSAITRGKVELLSEASDEVKEQVRIQIEDNRVAGIEEHYEQVKIHQTEICNYKKEMGTCVITLQSAVEYLYYKMDDGRVIGGNQKLKTQTKYNVELLYIQDANLHFSDNALGTKCPNCGAPITNLGHMKCEYCGMAVTAINSKVWSLHKFYEVDYKHC